MGAMANGVAWAVRTRWVDYKEKEYDPYVLLSFPPLPSLLPSKFLHHPKCTADIDWWIRGQIEPGWHAWMSYLVDKPPTEDAILRTKQRPWELPDHRPNLTASRAAYKTYST